MAILIRIFFVLLWLGVKMKILALEKSIRGVSSDDFQPHLEKEAQKVWQLQKQDIIREIYFRADRREAVIILECSNIDDAREALSTLPLAKAGLIEFELIPLRQYSGFERLFKANP